MTYAITKAGSGLQLLVGDGSCYYLPEPVLTQNPAGQYPALAASLTLRSGNTVLTLSETDTVSVAGVGWSGTIADLTNQLLFLL